MKPGEIFTKTMPFCWAKLFLGLITVVASILLFAVLMGIAWLFNSGGVGFFMFLIWIIGTSVVHYVVNHYLGYLVKAGHVAVITEAVVAGRVPGNQVSYGKEQVKDRFATSNVYFLLDRLVGGAVKQLQNCFERLGGGLGKLVPGMGALVSVGKMFIGIALGYIDECCLGYTFYKKEQGAFKSATDGVVIYAQNWKKLLKDAAVTTAVVVVSVITVTLVCFLVFGVFARLLGVGEMGALVAFALACFTAFVVKKAFIDSYMMIKMMVSYMQEAPATVITFDLYNSLCGMSARFKELFTKAQSEGTMPNAAASPSSDAPATNDKPVFCGECGAKNKTGTKFCGECGQVIN